MCIRDRYNDIKLEFLEKLVVSICNKMELLENHLVSTESLVLDPQLIQMCIRDRVEYIIGGRASDKDNLKIVIAEILALRAAANMAYLAGSASKQAQAMALAAIIGGITLTPEVIEEMCIRDRYYRGGSCSSVY